MYFHRLLLLFVLIRLVTTAAPAWAGGTVQLELVGDAKGSALAFQQWARALGKAGVGNVRIRTVKKTGKPRIDVQGTAENPVYVVTGIVHSRDELQLPGGRFRRGEVGRLVKWLNDLAEHGPAAGKEKKTVFGLSAAEFKRVRKDLAAPVGFTTQGMARGKIVRKIAGQLKLPLEFDAKTARAMAKDKEDKVEEELSDVSRGTALACALRPVGYGLVPRVAGGRPAYAVVKMRPRAAVSVEVWPVGWKLEKLDREALPALYKFRNVNVQNVSAAAAIEAIGKRLKTPVLVDRYALARHGIDPGKVMVSLPRSRTTYSLALRKLLFQARLKFEVRYDEAGAPLLWISTIKPLSTDLRGEK